MQSVAEARAKARGKGAEWVLHIYRAAFGSFNFGYATALSMIFGALLFIVSFIQLHVSRRMGVRA